MRPIIKLAAVLAIVISTGAQAHDFKAAAQVYRDNLRMNAKILNGIECNTARLVTCDAANAAHAAADVMDMVPPDASNAAAIKAFEVAKRVASITLQNERYSAWMFDQLKDYPEKRRQLATALDSAANASGYFGLAVEQIEGRVK